MNSWKPNYCFNPTGETAEAEARVVFHVATSEDEWPWGTRMQSGGTPRPASARGISWKTISTSNLTRPTSAPTTSSYVHTFARVKKTTTSS